jgi:hypothetical protein
MLALTGAVASNGLEYLFIGHHSTRCGSLAMADKGSWVNDDVVGWWVRDA